VDTSGIFADMQGSFADVQSSFAKMKGSFAAFFGFIVPTDPDTTNAVPYRRLCV